MKISSIESTSFNGGVKIIGAENKSCPYLYNHVLKLTRDYKIPANFHTDKIELPTVTKTIIEKLNELGVKFNNK